MNRAVSWVIRVASALVYVGIVVSLSYYVVASMVQRHLDVTLMALIVGILTLAFCRFSPRWLFQWEFVGSCCACGLSIADLILRGLYWQAFAAFSLAISLAIVVPVVRAVWPLRNLQDLPPAQQRQILEQLRRHVDHSGLTR